MSEPKKVDNTKTKRAPRRTKVDFYEYEKPQYEGFISEERKKQLIEELKRNIEIKDSTIAHHKILDIAVDNDDELDFMYNWLEKQHITIRGLNGTFSREVLNFEQQVRYAKEIMPEPVPIEEQKEYYDRIAAGDEKARQEFIERNTRLALWMVGTNRWIQSLDMEEEDKISYAYEGLIHAVDKFDPSIGLAFSTYAYKSIIYQLMRGEKEQRKNKTGMPFYVLEEIDKLSDIENEFKAQGVKVQSEDIAQLLIMPIEKVDELLRLRNELLYPNSFEQIKEEESDIADKVIDNASDADAIQVTESGYVLDGVYVEPEEIPSYEENFIGHSKHEDSVDIEEQVNQKDLKERMDEALGTLTERETGVLRFRYGLNGGEPQTLEDTGKEYSVSRERIRQIEAKALRKLRHPSRSKIIISYFHNIGSSGPNIRYKRKTVTRPEVYDPMTPVDDSINITTATEILRRTPKDEKTKYELGHSEAYIEDDDILPDDATLEENVVKQEDLEEDSFAEFFDSEEEDDLVNEPENNEPKDESDNFEEPDETDEQEEFEELDEFDEFETFDTVDEEIGAIRNEYLKYKEKETVINAKLATYKAEINQILASKEPIQKRLARVERLMSGENAEFLLEDMGQKDLLEQIRKSALEDLKLQEEREKQAKEKYEQAEEEMLENEEKKEEIKEKLDKFFDEL